MLAAQLLRIRAGFGFFDDANDLRFGEAGLSQGGFLSRFEPQDFCLEKQYFNGYPSARANLRFSLCIPMERHAEVLTGGNAAR